MVGRNPGYVTTQGEILSDRFSDAGYNVVETSAHANRYVRLVQIVYTLLSRLRDVDILMVQTYGGPSFVVEDVATWIGKLFNRRIVVHLRGGAMPEFMARFPRWSRRVLLRAELIIAPSEYLARAVAKYGFRVRVIPNIIDLSAYQYRHRRMLQPKIFWMRSFHQAYNPGMAIRVLAKLRYSVDGATLVMAGQDKGLEAEVRRLAHELGLNGAVRFCGFADMDKKAMEGSAADIFINTNSIDNTPVAVLEACAMGLPVVSTDVGGVPDLLTNGVTGLLVKDNDVESMVSAIERLLRDPDLAGRLSENGRKLADSCSWEKVLPTWQQLIRELMQSPRSSIRVQR
jgi:L-malate glycosyltransferase